MDIKPEDFDTAESLAGKVEEIACIQSGITSSELRGVVDKFEEVHSVRPTESERVALYMAVARAEMISDVRMSDAIGYYKRELEAKLTDLNLGAREKERLERERTRFERIVRK